MSKINVLDHGYVRLLNVASLTRRPDEDYDASFRDPAIAARLSFDKDVQAQRSEVDDLRLLEYLLSHNHNTPVEMVEVWLEMKLPIFVARQFVRHRTATLNEVSARYVTLPEEWYIPEVVGGKAKTAKQGQENNLPASLQTVFKANLNDHCRHSYDQYLHFINKGVAPEHARMFLHLNHFTRWVWKQDIHNLLHFLKLRSAGNAQIEARRYAEAISALLWEAVPELMSAAEKHQ